MSGTIEIQGEKLTISENKSSDIALSSFSGLIGFVGELSTSYGGTPGKIIGLIYAVSGGIVTGVFDKNMNPQKELDNIIGTAAIGLAASWAGAKTGAIIGGTSAGPVGTVVGAVIGSIAAGLWGDDVYDNTEKLIKLLSKEIEEFKYRDVKTLYEITKNEILIKDIQNNDPNHCKLIATRLEGVKEKITLSKETETLASYITNKTNKLNTQGIQELKELSLQLTKQLEQNQEEKIQTLEKNFEEINSKITLEEKLVALKEIQISKTLENFYSKQLIDQYQEKVLEKQGIELTSLELLNLKIEKRTIPQTNEQKQEEKDYISFESSTTVQNNNSQIQTMN